MVKEESAFIDTSLRQFAENKGFLAGIWFKERLCGTITRWIRQAQSVHIPARGAVINEQARFVATRGGFGGDQFGRPPEVVAAGQQVGRHRAFWEGRHESKRS